MPRNSHPLLIAITAAALACGGSHDTADTTSAGDVAASDPCGTAASTQITPAGIGPLRLGERVGDLPESCAPRDTTFTLGEGIMEQGSVVTIGGAPVLAMTSGSAEGVVSRIIVDDPAFRTEYGVGVGSTVADLRRAQGRICAFQGEGNTVVQAASVPGISFEIGWSSADAPDQLLNEVFGQSEPSAAIDTAHITNLWIFEGRTACGGS